MTANRKLFVLCIENKAYAASLEVRKVYRTISDPEGERHGFIRVIDENGDHYLYPRRCFVPIEIPEEARRCFALTSRAKLRASMPKMNVPSEVLIRQERDER